MAVMSFKITKSACTMDAPVRTAIPRTLDELEFYFNFLQLKINMMRVFFISQFLP